MMRLKASDLSVKKGMLASVASEKLEDLFY